MIEEELSNRLEKHCYTSEAVHACVKNIIELTEKEINILATEWANEFDRPNLYYTRLLKETINGTRSTDKLPYFTIKSLIKLGFDFESKPEV